MGHLMPLSGLGLLKTLDSFFQFAGMPRMAVGVTADEEEANDTNSYLCQLQPSVAWGEVNTV
jgi:hypothetical protein